MSQSNPWQGIPTHLTLEQFKEFVLPHLHIGSRGPQPKFNPTLFHERFYTIERVFAWEDEFLRLLMRFERISKLHYALKTLAYTMINLRHFYIGKGFFIHSL
jgi:hypothetical protein